MIARYAVDRLAEAAELVREVGIARRLVVDDVAAANDRVDRQGPRRRQHAPQRRQRVDAAQLTIRIGEQMRIGQLQQADIAIHWLILLACSRAPSDALQAP